MDLTNLKWTKNIKHPDGDLWAYQNFNIESLFKLNWKNNTSNADQPKKDDLILLRQKGYVTHLVKVLDYKHERETWEGDYNIYRIVEALWVINFEYLPTFAKADNVFGYPEVLYYQGGNVMEIATLPTFKEYWDSNGGCDAFKKHFHKIISLSFSF
ncbi:MAG: hypothetical protein KME64_16220 [Scytonematopsis contorta HA4267-MV1]|jgi:hypothetical protein|nr:hypothetical protein [Scytonematopsis contorta HA4267-MV1]